MQVERKKTKKKEIHIAATTNSLLSSGKRWFHMQIKYVNEMHSLYLGFLFKLHYFKSRTLELGTLIEQEETDVLLITDMEEELD